MSAKQNLVDMKFRFCCHMCGKRASQGNTSIKPFVFAYWYTEPSGLQHGCLYCRSCGAVHDTVGTILGGLKILFGGFPSKVIVSYGSDNFQQKVETGDIFVIPRVVARAMIEDGRLSPEWDNEANVLPTSR